MCHARGARIVVWSFAGLCLIRPAFAQSGVVKLQQTSIHVYSRILDMPYVEGTVSVAGLYPDGEWTVEPYEGKTKIEVSKHKALEPPGARDVKVADLYMGADHFDVVLDNGHYALARAGSKGGSGDGEIFFSQWPTDPDGSYVPQEIADASPWPGYEFLTWTGDPVNRGYVPDPTSSLLSVHAEYFYDTGKQYYAYALFGVPTALGGGLVSLPDTPVSLVFEDIDAAGHTILTMSDAGPGSPPGFQLGDPGTYFDISTTAVFSGGIDVAIDYSTLAFTVSPDELRLFHYENDLWVDCTTSVDTLNHTIYGHVTSLSPFGVFEAVPVVPAPGALILSGIGLVALRRMRRRLV